MLKECLTKFILNGIPVIDTPYTCLCKYQYQHINMYDLCKRGFCWNSSHIQVFTSSPNKHAEPAVTSSVHLDAHMIVPFFGVTNSIFMPVPFLLSPFDMSPVLPSNWVHFYRECINFSKITPVYRHAHRILLSSNKLTCLDQNFAAIHYLDCNQLLENSTFP